MMVRFFRHCIQVALRLGLGLRRIWRIVDPSGDVQLPPWTGKLYHVVRPAYLGDLVHLPVEVNKGTTYARVEGILVPKVHIPARRVVVALVDGRRGDAELDRHLDGFQVVAFNHVPHRDL